MSLETLLARLMARPVLHDAPSIAAVGSQTEEAANDAHAMPLVPPEKPTSTPKPASALAVPPASTVPAWPRVWPPMTAAEIELTAQRLDAMREAGFSDDQADKEADLMLLVDREMAATPTPPAQHSTAQTAQRKPYQCSASDEAWRGRDRSYLAHHWSCAVCIAAGHGRGQRCHEGLALLRAVDAGNTH